MATKIDAWKVWSEMKEIEGVSLITLFIGRLPHPLISFWPVLNARIASFDHVDDVDCLQPLLRSSFRSLFVGAFIWFACRRFLSQSESKPVTIKCDGCFLFYFHKVFVYIHQRCWSRQRLISLFSSQKQTTLFVSSANRLLDALIC